jgi:hypothetical protein
VTVTDKFSAKVEALASAKASPVIVVLIDICLVHVMIHSSYYSA